MPAAGELAQLRAENAALRARNDELQASDLRLRRLLDSEILGVLIGGVGGRVIEANRTFERILGRSAAQMSGMEWEKCAPPEEMPLHLEKARLLWESGLCPPWETTFLRPDGSRVPVITGATLVEAANRQSSPADQPLQRTMLLWALDISERKNVENELRTSENRMRAIIECLHDGLVITDLDDIITYANGRISEMCGYSNAELIGQPAYRLLAPREHWAACEQRNQQRARGESGTYEIPLRHKDGSTLWALINGSPLRDAQGQIVGTIGAHFDITERKNIEAQKAQFRARLELSNRDLEAFAYAVSHDLKEPLRKIEVFGARLDAANGAQMAPSSRDYLRRMRGAARRMGGLIDGLLLYSRVATGADAAREVDLSVVAREALLDLELAIERADARIEIGELPRVFAEPTQMRQLLQNLLANALAYRRPDVPLVVRVAGAVRGGVCALEIADNGRGFDPRDAEKIFEIFQRLPTASASLFSDKSSGASAPNVGVGLTICRKIVEHHGGTIEAHSVPGAGAVFRIEFPAVPVVTAHETTPPPEESGREF